MTGGSTTVTWSWTTGAANAAIAVDEYSGGGSATVDSVSQFIGNQTNSTSHTSHSSLTVTGTDLIYAICALSGEYHDMGGRGRLHLAGQCPDGRLEQPPVRRRGHGQRDDLGLRDVDERDVPLRLDGRRGAGGRFRFAARPFSILP